MHSQAWPKCIFGEAVPFRISPHYCKLKGNVKQGEKSVIQSFRGGGGKEERKQVKGRCYVHSAFLSMLSAALNIW